MQIKKNMHFRDLDGFSPHISRLVLMMDFTRETTLYAVQNLSQVHLDTALSEKGNTIGMLLAHIAGVECWYQSHTFDGNQEGWDLPEYVLGDIGREHIKSHALDYYLEKLATVRQKTLEEFSKRDDDWLHETSRWWGGETANNYFKWFHVFEDELNHRGQIRLIRKALKDI